MSLYSLKMRSSMRGKHISGAEKIIDEADLYAYSQALISRGLNHAKGNADFLNLKIEKVNTDEILSLEALPVTTRSVENDRESKAVLRDFLKEIGVAGRLEQIAELFRKTYSMRGAMLLDIHTLKRLEPDKQRGIRATYMDLEHAGGETVTSAKNHFMEALVLATKVANAPGIVGEICISDDPDYVTGYVSSKKRGYVRITRMKEMGSPLGGRIFFYDGKEADAGQTIAFLENQRVIVKNVVLSPEIVKSVKEANAVPEEPGDGAALEKSAGKFAFAEQELKDLKEKNLFRSEKVISSMQGSHVKFQGEDKLMLASNNYLNMICNPEVREYAAKAAIKYGAGSGGSRLTTGTTDLHKRLEKKIAAFEHCEAAIVFNTGYVANLAAISTLSGKEDIIFSDALNHASIVDGCRFSKAKVVVYGHNDMEDLEKKIKENMPCKGMIVSDAVFSMDGDILKLPEFVSTGNRYGLITMIDEAHSIGVIGKTGKGIREHFQYKCAKPDLIMGTLSKSVGSEGGFVCGDEQVITYLRNKARGYIFSTSLSPVAMAASYKALEVMEQHPELTENLQRNRKTFCEALASQGITAKSETAIVPIVVGDERKAVWVQEKLLEEGYFISAIRYPAVERGSARLRAALMANHGTEELKDAAKSIAKAVREA